MQLFYYCMPSYYYTLLKAYRRHWGPVVTVETIGTTHVNRGTVL